MNITLNKANKIRNKLQTRIDELRTELVNLLNQKLSISAAVVERSIIDDMLKKQRSLIYDKQNKIVEYIEVTFAIRAIISNYNNKCGIDSLLNLMETIKNVNNLSKVMIAKCNMTSESDIEDILFANKKNSLSDNFSDSNRYGRNISVMNEDVIEHMKVSIQENNKILSDLEEQRNQLNYETIVEFNDYVIKFLVQEGFL